MGMDETKKLIEIYKQLEDAGLMVIAGKKDTAELMVSHDVVPVVRCKNCIHWVHMEDGMGDCTNSRFHLDGHANPTMKKDDFCSCGERRSDD